MLIEFLGHGFHAPQNHLRLFADAHQNDAFHRLILLPVSELAEPRRVADFHLGDIFHVNRNPILLLQNDVADIRLIAHQAQSADIVKLPALGIKAATRIGIVVTKLLRNLRDCHPVREQLVRIEQHLILHVGAAEARVIGNALDGAVMPLQHPVFDHLQVLRRTIGTLQNVAVDQAAGAE